MMLAIDLLYIALIMFRYVPCIPDPSKRLFDSDVHMVDDADGFSCIELSLHPWNDVYLIIMNDVFDVFLDLV